MAKNIILNFALFGIGRIGKIHGKNIFENTKSKLLYVYDTNNNEAIKIAKKYHCEIAKNPDEALNDKKVNAVLIASPTNTHINLIIKSAKKGKAILCEKPIDLNIKNIIKCEKLLKKFNIPIQIGFNRRFDNTHAKLKKSCDQGIIGKKEMIIITSRDPSPPSFGYLKYSGGILRDMTIHDFDISRFILGDDKITEVHAQASNIFDKNIKKLNDYDTVMITMKSQSGVLIHINNSRRAVYGYDQRIEVLGSKGMLISDNQTPNSMKKFLGTSTESKESLYNFFVQRYELAYKNQLNSFIKSIVNKKLPLASFKDGKEAIILANAAYKSLNTGKTIRL